MDNTGSFDFRQLCDEELKTISGGISKPQLARHTVQQGETLEIIAKMYHSSVAGILILNKLSNATDIYPGMNLYVPIMW